MTLENILWGLSGYIAFLIFQLVKPSRNRSGWDFVLQVSLFSICSYALSQLLRALFLLVAPTQYTDTIRHFWYFIFPSKSIHFAVGLFVSVFVGGIIAFTWSKYHNKLSKLSNFLGGKNRDFEFSDTFFATCHNLLGKLVLLTLKGGKVYVGVLTQATQDPNESMRFLKITPVLSGYRNKETFRVSFNTNYVFDIQNDDSSTVKPPARDILIPVAEISTMAEFDKDLHDQFVKIGITKIETTTATQNTENQPEQSSI